MNDHLGRVDVRVRPVGAPPQPLQLRPDLPLLPGGGGVLLGGADLGRPLAEREPARLPHVGVGEAGADGAKGGEGAPQVLVQVEGQPLVPQAVVVAQVQVLRGAWWMGVLSPISITSAKQKVNYGKLDCENDRLREVVVKCRQALADPLKSCLREQRFEQPRGLLVLSPLLQQVNALGEGVSQHGSHRELA